jgi:5-aminopentanamidase
MKIAVYQSPVSATIARTSAIELVAEQMEWCDSNHVDLLCCPEAMLGGLADYSQNPRGLALNIVDGEFKPVLSRLESYAVTCVFGFTERGGTGELYNAAAVVKEGSLVGVYRKVHPAINSSVYTAGDRASVFHVNRLCFGIMICRDSNYPEFARSLVARGAAAILVPSNNALPHGRATPGIVKEARAADVARATENGVPVARADVVGQTEDLRGYGSSGITGPNGTLLAQASDEFHGCLMAEFPPLPAHAAASVSHDLHADRT